MEKSIGDGFDDINPTVIESDKEKEYDDDEENVMYLEEENIIKILK